MSIVIVSTQERKHNPFVNGMVYGVSGIGKTVLAATAPSPLIISAEDGLLSLAEKDIPTTDIRSLKELVQVYNFICNESHDFKTIIIDSISEVAQVLLVEYAAKERDKRQAYMKMADEVLALVRKFRRLPLNTILNAKQARIIDEFSGKTSFGPKFPGRVLENELPYQLDEVLAMRFHKFEGKEFRVLQTAPDIQYEAKDRSGKLSKLEKPDLTKLFNKMQGEKELSEKSEEIVEETA